MKLGRGSNRRTRSIPGVSKTREPRGVLYRCSNMRYEKVIKSSLRSESIYIEGKAISNCKTTSTSRVSKLREPKRYQYGCLIAFNFSQFSCVISAGACGKFSAAMSRCSRQHPYTLMPSPLTGAEYSLNLQKSLATVQHFSSLLDFSTY